MKRNLYKRVIAVCSTMAFVGMMTPDMCLTEALLPAAEEGILLTEFAQQVSALAAQDDYASYYDTLEITVGESAVLADGAEIALDKAAERIDGEIYVPAQFLIDLCGTDQLKGDSMVPLRQTAESLGFTVTETGNGAVVKNRFQTSRLIVKSDSPIDSFGAKESIEGFENLHIFQYETPAEAFSAYQNYLLMDAVEDVAPSEYVSVAENTIGVSDVHYTWGADVMQTDTYCDFLLEQSESLPEVVVAVIDTGIDFEHEWFEGRLAGNGVNFVDTGSALPQDDHSHGTHVSGTICDLTPDNVKILPLKVLDAKGQASTEQVYCAMLYANANAVDVVNMSLGGGGYTFLYEDAINAGTEAGIVYCIAAGNDASDCSLYGPANIKSAITVSAVEQNGDPAYFTNYGAGIDFAAPGVSIISAKLGGGTVAFDGTSMASPHAAACCALLKSYDRSLNTEQIVDILSLHADDLGEPGFDPYYGNGRISMDFTGANTAMCAQPQFAPQGGVYDAAQTVTITADADCAIYYTTDNTVPTAENGTLYTGPITVSSSVILRAAAVCAGKETNTASAHYQIGGADVADALVVSDGVLVAYNGIQTELDLTAYPETAEITAIGNSVFENNKQLEKIILPETVTQIGDRAFFGCSNLDFSAVDFSKLETIGAAAFSECTALSGEIRLDSLRSLGASAFSFTEISAVYLSENITTVPERCFYDCRAVRGIYADGVTVLEDYALAFNTDEPITFGIDWTKVTKIGAYAVCEQDFSAPVFLDAIEILSPRSFSVCSFDTLRISGMKELAEGAFYECTASFIYLDDVQNIALEHLPTAGYLILSDTCTSVTCAQYYQKDATIIGYGGSEAHRLALESDHTFLELPCGVLADDETVSVYQYDHTTLSVLAIGFDLTYQWYVSESPEDAGTAVAGATQAEFTVPTDTAGTFYYRCEMTCRGYAPSFTNGTYMVVVQPCEQIPLTEGEPFVFEDETYAIVSFTPSADGTYTESGQTALEFDGTLTAEEPITLDFSSDYMLTYSITPLTEAPYRFITGEDVWVAKLYKRGLGNTDGAWIETDINEPDVLQQLNSKYEYAVSFFCTDKGTHDVNLIRTLKLPEAEITVQDYLYTGQEIIPEFTISFPDAELTEGVDYVVEYDCGTEPGLYSVLARGINRYNGVRVANYQIVRAVEESVPVLEQGAHTLTFTEPGEVQVYRFDSLQKLYLLRAAADFGVKIAFTDANGETIADTLSGCANMEWEVALTNASAYYFHISLTDPSATGTVEFSVTDKYRRLEFVKVNRPVLPYSGELQTPEFILTDGDYTLVEGTDYYIQSISGNTNGGEYSAPIVGMGQYYGVLYGEYIITPPMDLDLTQAVEWESLKQTIILDLKDRTDLLVHFTVEESGRYYFRAQFSSVAGADLSVIPATPSCLLFDSAFHFYSFDLVEYLPTGDYYLLFIDIASDFYDELEMWTKDLGDQLETSGGLLYETDGGSATIIGHTDTGVEMIALPFSVDGLHAPILYIADYAFAGYENLRSVDLREIWKGPKKYIGRGAFLGTALESITLDRNWYLDQYSVGYDADYNPIEGFTIYGYRGTDAQRYAEENGFIFVDMESKGDLNGDTLVDASDATIILKAYAQALNNGQAVPEELTTTGDVDSNGKLDADDAVAILKVYANYILTGEIDWSVAISSS